MTSLNLGDIPATVRISVRTARGRILGRSIELGIPEDESLHITDIEQQTGATIDDNAIVDITVIAGTCVGYATVVETDGSNQFIAAGPSPKG